MYSAGYCDSVWHLYDGIGLPDQVFSEGLHHVAAAPRVDDARYVRLLLEHQLRISRDLRAESSRKTYIYTHIQANKSDSDIVV